MPKERKVRRGASISQEMRSQVEDLTDKAGLENISALGRLSVLVLNRASHRQFNSRDTRLLLPEEGREPLLLPQIADADDGPYREMFNFMLFQQEHAEMKGHAQAQHITMNERIRRSLRFTSYILEHMADPTRYQDVLFIHRGELVPMPDIPPIK
jgi:hypothetical protein